MGLLVSEDSHNIKVRPCTQADNTQRKNSLVSTACVCIIIFTYTCTLQYIYDYILYIYKQYAMKYCSVHCFKVHFLPCCGLINSMTKEFSKVHDAGFVYYTSYRDNM